MITDIILRSNKMEITKETIDLYKKRVANCIKVAKNGRKRHLGL